MKPIAVTLAVVLQILKAVGPPGPCDERVAEAIYERASADPVWKDREDGIERTVVILSSLAMHEGRKDPGAEGDFLGGHARSFGLYGIMSPVWGFTKEVLQDPKASTAIAIQLVRQSMHHCAHRHWRERLSWYAASQGCRDVHKVILDQSWSRMRMADEMMQKFFPVHAAAVPGDPSGPTAGGLTREADGGT